MRIACIRHISFEKIGVIEQWAQLNNHSLVENKPYLGEQLPSLDSFDFLIIMGGPQEAYELEKYTYLKKEIELIKEAVAQDKLVLGICLGAQLLAVALGGKAIKAAEKEIGIYPVQLTEKNTNYQVFNDFPKIFNVIQWHSDTVILPEETVLLAQNTACQNQAFAYKKNAYGIQFHLEITKEILSSIIAHLPHELDNSKYTQSKEELLSADLSDINKQMHKMLDNLVDCYKF